MPPVAASPRCARCRRGHQKCTLGVSGTACARCTDLGYECELPQLLAEDAEADEAAPEPTPARPSNNAPTRSRHKCDTCRRHHMSCHPFDRVWPQKCQRCIDNGYECGPPRSKKEHDDAAALDPDGSLMGSVSGRPKRRFRRRESKRQPQPPPHSEEHFQPIVSDVLYTAGAAARDADGDGDDGSSTDSSIPAVLPAKRGTSSAAAAGPPPPKRQATGPGPTAAFAFEVADDAPPPAAEGAKLAQLKGMVRAMEEEFREVLRGEQAKHEQELGALRAKYETDLKEQRERYESRIDDLIKILGSTIASKS